MKWKQIKDFEGVYEVSDTGLVKRTKTTKILKPVITHKGYKKVVLYNKSKGKGKFVHRLVAIAFLENKTKKPCVNHKNANKLDNNFENLEWCSVKENNSHAKLHSLYKPNSGEQHGMSKFSSKEVKEIRIKAKFQTYISIAKEYKVSPSTIRRIVIKETWKK